ncbi:MAG: succinate dehydrogenase [Chloroflexota bacterium]
MVTSAQETDFIGSIEATAWKWMRFSGVALIPLVGIHLVLLEILVGVRRINLDYVAMRWTFIGWRVYDFLLLALAFSHGMNGLRQVLGNFVGGGKARQVVNRGLLAVWAVFILAGSIAIIGGVRYP